MRKYVEENMWILSCLVRRNQDFTSTRNFYPFWKINGLSVGMEKYSMHFKKNLNNAILNFSGEDIILQYIFRREKESNISLAFEISAG